MARVIGQICNFFFNIHCYTKLCAICLFTGMSLSEIIITVLPDDEPETDEVLSVTLTSVEPPETQRLRPGASTMQIIILENDNPGGTFQFSPLMLDSYTAEVLFWVNQLQYLILALVCDDITPGKLAPTFL